MKNYQALLLVALGFTLSIQTLNGTLQEVIPFAGIKNEMAFALIGICIGLCGITAINYKKLIKGLL